MAASGFNSSRPRAAPSDSRLLKPIIPSAHVLTITYIPPTIQFVLGKGVLNVNISHLPFNMAASGIMGFNSSRPRAAPSDSRLLKPIIPSAHVLTITYST